MYLVENVDVLWPPALATSSACEFFWKIMLSVQPAFELHSMWDRFVYLTEMNTRTYCCPKKVCCWFTTYLLRADTSFTAALGKRSSSVSLAGSLPITKLLFTVEEWRMGKQTERDCSGMKDKGVSYRMVTHQMLVRVLLADADSRCSYHWT